MAARRVYVAEDTPEDRLIAEAVLARVPDLEITWFADGLDAYNAVRRCPPDLLMLDIILPSLSGLAVARLLKFHKHFAAVPVIVSSSITEADLAERASRVGADAFLRKPYDVLKMSSEVTRLLGEPRG